MSATATRFGFRNQSADHIGPRHDALALLLLAAAVPAVAGAEPAAKTCIAAPGIHAESVAATNPTRAPDQIAQADRLARRGETSMAQGNIAVARQYFVRAAELGHAAAAFKVAETYDPLELARRNIRGVVADSSEAQRWYERARTLRSESAEVRLSRLGNWWPCPEVTPVRHDN
jgi:TPR repeat protein